jgi:hypothetical protein
MGLIVQTLPIAGDKGDAEAEVLFDSGASSSFVKKDVAEKVATIVRARRPMTFQLGDGQGTLTARETVTLYVTIKEYEIFDHFLVVDNLAVDMIIGARTQQVWHIKLDMEHEDVEIERKMMFLLAWCSR